MAEDATAVTATATAESLPGDEGESGAPSVGETFELLRDRRDRYALYHLRRRDGVADLRELVKQVLAWEAGDRPAAFPPARVDRVVEEFAVERLPRLKRAGLVEFNRRTGCVVFTVAADDVVKYLDLAIDDEPFRGTPSDPFEY